ncbi:MAG: hypothetical protein HDS01_04535 [Bacteroides sp.]|nr:hypothetical protein [Bacteroides sp.]
MSNLINAPLVVKKAADYDLDELIELFVCDSTPEQIRRELQTLYFLIVNYFGKGEEILSGYYADALFTLQNIIEAVENMNDNPGGARLSIIAK